MSRSLQLLFATLLTTAGVGVGAQEAPVKLADSISAQIERATLTSDLSKLKAAREAAVRAAAAYPNDGLILHYEGYALFRESNVMFAQNPGSQYPTLEQAQAALEKSRKLRVLPETYALLSSIQAQLIGKDPSRAGELGQAAVQSLEVAFSTDPANPRVWLFRGISSLYTPAEYGGGAQVAVEPLKRAVELFATDAPRPGEPSWGKAEAHLWLGQVYEKLGDKGKAASEYAAALQIAPEFSWARSLQSALK